MKHSPDPKPVLLRPELQRLATVAVKGRELRYRRYRKFTTTTAELVAAAAVRMERGERG